MEMTIEHGRDASVCVVSMRGEIDMSTVPEVRSSVESLVFAGCTNVVLDLALVTYVDSSALGLVVWLDRLLGPRQGRLVLAGANRDVSRILELSGLIGLAPTIVAAVDVSSAVSGLDLSDRSAEPLWTDSLSLAADIEELPGIRTQVCELLDGIDMSEAALFDVRVAVGEALANAIRHGSPGGGEDMVRVMVSAYEDRVAIQVTDSGAGFDGTPGDSDDLYAASGRGVMFMRALMDRVDFSTVTGGGTSVTLVKHLDGSGAVR